MAEHADSDSAADLERLAVQELLLEAKRGAERAKVMGAAGWIKPVIPPTNKKFLENTLRSTLPRKIKQIQQSEVSDEKPREKSPNGSNEKHRKAHREDSIRRARNSDGSSHVYSRGGKSSVDNYKHDKRKYSEKHISDKYRDKHSHRLRVEKKRTSYHPSEEQSKHRRRHSEEHYK